MSKNILQPFIPQPPSQPQHEIPRQAKRDPQHGNMLVISPHAALVRNHGSEVFVKIFLVQVTVALAHDELVRHVPGPGTDGGAQIERFFGARLADHDSLQLVQVLAHNVHLAAHVGL